MSGRGLGNLLGLSDSATRRALAHCGVVHPVLDERLELRAEVAAVERLLPDDRWRSVGARCFAVPAKAVWDGAGEREVRWGRRRGLTSRVHRPHTLDDQPDRVREAHGVVRCVGCKTRACIPQSAPIPIFAGHGRPTGQQEHLALLDPDVSELAVIDHAQEHPALVLVEPLLQARRQARGKGGKGAAHLGLVDMVVVAFVRPTDDHDHVVRARVQAEVVDRGLEQVPVLLQPLWEVDRRCDRHRV